MLIANPFRGIGSHETVHDLYNACRENAEKRSLQV